MAQRDSSSAQVQALYIDPVAIWLRKSFLNPWLMGVISVFLVYDSERDFALLALRNNDKLQLAIATTVFAVVGLILRINNYLSNQFHNNWTKDETWNWDKEIVLITGGSSGIGAKVAERLIELNSNTTIVIIDYAPLTFAPSLGSKLHYYQCDLSKSDNIKATCAAVRKDIGDPTVVFNNAGLTRGATVMDGSYADVEITFRTNIIAPFLILKEFLPAMARKNHGHIVGTSSMSAIIPPAGLADYAATKSALMTLHEALAQELRFKHNAPKVRLSLVVLSFVATPMFKGEVSKTDFFLPLMTVNTVCDHIVEVLRSGYGRNIYLPGLMRYISCLRGWPAWTLRLLANDTNSLKVDYVGRQKVDQSTGHLQT